MAIIACQLAIAEVFRCRQVNGEPADDWVAVCGGASKADPNKYEMTKANTEVNDKAAHNCVGAPLQETKCCRKNAFKFQENVSIIPSEQFFQLSESKLLILS
ncbi:uncharacterized protein PGTG_10902 [Puccinia graminis f. sp. tritici CRL 75-36-700-3]|uniref:Uncharacterized protein n=1 Tax=Puccinia graminis f. sp. tritici (strain CRL 75-36-700-3 / race SCCL) TaxID=418459 RepID=E3KKB8_PUCGT|nr:uncharacterized protein PGTG_10902 [Puccinia graminis f. sp. tritici CRL 75-36-700-3]EFP84743.2 hypothetical protein PGTG_10902 [Puccinia graminis f. sp. tritici CRL 75-36-700-3]